MQLHFRHGNVQIDLKDRIMNNGRCIHLIFKDENKYPMSGWSRKSLTITKKIFNSLKKDEMITLAPQVQTTVSYWIFTEKAHNFSEVYGYVEKVPEHKVIYSVFILDYKSAFEVREHSVLSETKETIFYKREDDYGKNQIKICNIDKITKSYSGRNRVLTFSKIEEAKVLLLKDLGCEVGALQEVLNQKKVLILKLSSFIPFPSE